ncbi:MAG: translation elongation factor Ts, partial [Pseudomonadota bacterium]
SVEAGRVVPYIHGSVANGLGKIGVLVALQSEGDAAALDSLGKHIAMHVAATAPQSLSRDDLDPAIVDRERQVLIDQARQSGKPENIIEKMIEGRLKKFYQEVVLLEQTSVVDPDRTIGKVVEDTAKELGSPVTLTAFARFALGEGIEKEESDFAAEVAAAVAS